MKKIIIPISALFVVGLSHAQSTNLSTNENYVYSKTYLSDPALPNPKSVETVQYIDGLGRPKQVVNVKASPTQKDVVTHIEYDGFGRQVKDYLPVPQSNTLNGAIVLNPLANATQPEIYGSEKIYTEKILENSPLDRIQQQIQVGTDWNNKPVKFEYDANTEGEVKKYTATFNYSTFESQITLSATGYGANQLYKNTVTDEDGNKTVEFKNGRGQTILLRKMLDGTASADTYYVYNDYNQLAYVIPPLAVAANAVDETTLNNLCYRYKYDTRNRLVEKKIPGKGWEYMVYDKQDRLVLTQDANSREKGQWLFTKYDQFGRVALSGISDGSSRITEQLNTDAKGLNYEYMIELYWTNSGMPIYYTNQHAYPNANIYKVLNINYYDKYPSDIPAIPTQILGQNVLPQDAQNSAISTKSFPTASYIKNIEDDNWTKSYTWYDTRGRSIGSYSINHLGGYTKTESELDFSGTPKQVVTRHKRLNTDTERVITENFTYDHQNRLLVHTHQVDNNPVEYLAQNEYNPLSQLKTKKVGGVSSSTPLQTVDYQYNIRGWMTKINDPVNLGTNFFGYKMKYTDPEYNAVGSGRYNGNIAEIDWNMSTINSRKRYTYAYDGLNRLSDAVYTEPDQTDPNTFYYNENLTYDKNGNIKTLKRFAYPEVGSTIALKVDDLDYQYEGNRLTQVIETSLNIGYEGGNGIMDYDNNGNMTAMPDKGLFNMRYNHLNLPSKMSIFQPYNPAFGSYDMNYLYRADGVKLRKKFTSVPERSGNVTTKITDYLDGFHYNQTQVTTPCMFCPVEFAYEERAYRKVAPQPIGLESAFALDFVGTSEGFFSFKENRYIYQYRDHLGNARVSYAKKTDGTVEITDTNDYYAFGLNHIGGVNKGYLGSYYNYKYNGKEIQETGMYDYGARFYMPDIGRWGVVDPLAEKYRRWSPYNYVMNNPLRFIDPDGMQVMDPGDKFKNLRSAAKDFGKEYNGLSINYNLELSTFFYKSTDANGETFYSYTVPKTGSEGMTSTIKPEDVAEASKLGEIVADGHSHGGDTRITITDGKEYSGDNKFSGQDIKIYKNELINGNGKKEDNGYGKPITGYITTADGGLREFIPGVSNDSNSAKKDARGMPIKNYDIPIDTSLPSDPASGSLRFNKTPPTHIPKKLPTGFDLKQPKRYEE